MNTQTGRTYNLLKTAKSWAGLNKDPGSMASVLVLAAVVSSLVSVAASGIFLGLGIVAWIVDRAGKRRMVLKEVPFRWYLFLFLALTALSAVLSVEPLRDTLHMKSCIKFVIPFLLITYMTENQARKALFWIFGIAGVSMAWGLIQFLTSDGVNLLDRIDGFMSHWMTYSGQMMMVLVASAAWGVGMLRSSRGGRRLLSIPWFLFSALMAGVLVLTYTRSAWGGALGGLGVLVLLNLRPRWLLVLLAGVVIAFFLMPASVQDRLASGFDPADTTTRGRLDIWQSGIRVALENPFTGVGYSSVPAESLKFREETDLPEWAYQHSHNNLIQVAATSGIPSLLAWLALWLKIAWDFFRIWRRDRKDVFVSVQAAGGLAVLAAFHLMGLLEFNFGDSEILMLLLFFVSIPYVLHRDFEARMAGETPGNGNPGHNSRRNELLEEV